jgi:hypothetical protein
MHKEGTLKVQLHTNTRKVHVLDYNDDWLNMWAAYTVIRSYSEPRPAYTLSRLYNERLIQWAAYKLSRLYSEPFVQWAANTGSSIVQNVCDENGG